jgi:hypothetical protein
MAHPEPGPGPSLRRVLRLAVPGRVIREQLEAPSVPGSRLPGIEAAADGSLVVVDPLRVSFRVRRQVPAAANAARWSVRTRDGEDEVEVALVDLHLADDGHGTTATLVASPSEERAGREAAEAATSLLYQLLCNLEAEATAPTRDVTPDATRPVTELHPGAEPHHAGHGVAPGASTLRWRVAGVGIGATMAVVLLAWLARRRPADRRRSA